MKFLRACLVLALCGLSPGASFAWIHGLNTGPSGVAQINLGGNEISAETFTNILKACPYTTTSASTLFDADNYPIATLSDSPACNIPKTTLASSGPLRMIWPATRANCTFNLGANLTVNSSSNAVVSGGGNQTFTCDGVHAGFVDFTFTAPASIIRWTTPSTGTYAAGSGDWVLCRSTNNGGPPNDDCSRYTAGHYFTPEFIQTLTTVPQVSQPPTGLSEAWVRTMGWNAVTDQPDSTNWAYRQHVSGLGWTLGHWTPGARAGGATAGSATITKSTSAAAGTTPIIYTASASDDETNGVNGQSLGAWVDGEVIQGTPNTATAGLTISAAASDGGTGCSGGPCIQYTVNSTTGLNVGNLIYVQGIVGSGNIYNLQGKRTITAIGTGTITVDAAFSGSYTSGGGVSIQSLIVTGKAGGAAKIIAQESGAPFNSSTSLPNTQSAFWYDSASDLLFRFGEPQGMVPYEAQINLANDANINLWTNFTDFASASFLTSLGALTSSTLNSPLKVIHELGNEVWNSAHQPWGRSQVNSFFLGLQGGNIIQSPWYGLRNAQASQLFLSAGWSGRRSGIEIALMTQWCCAISGKTNQDWDGANLSPTSNQALCLFLGGTFSGTCSGATDYSSSPNRPIDLADTVGGAIYVGGIELNQGPDIGGTFVSNGTSWYQTLVTNWVSNNSTNQATAIASINTDILGINDNLAPVTVTCSGTTFTGPSPNSGTTAHNFYTFSTTGSFPSGLAANTVYILSTKGTGGANNFTLRGFTNGVENGADLNCGSGGSGTLSINGYPGIYPTLLSVSQAVNNSTSDHGTWQAKVATYTSGRPAGMSPLKIRWYEGAIEAQGGSASQYTTNSILPATVTPTCTTHTSTLVDGCSSMNGIYPGMNVSAADISGKTVATINVIGNSFTLSGAATGSNAGETVTVTGNGTASANAVNDAITAWKNDPSAATTMLYFYHGFMGTDPAQPGSFGIMTQAKSPSNLVLTGGSVWALYPGGLDTTPYQLYNGVASFNRGN